MAGVFALVAVGAAVTSRRVLDDQERRLLSERVGEVRAVLSNSVDRIESSLQLLGAVASTSDPATSRVFSQTAATLVEGNTRAVAVVVRRGGDFAVVASSGDGPAAGAILAASRATVAGRAEAAGKLVSGLLSDASGRRVMFAVPVGESVVFEELAIDPERPVPPTPGTPFRELRVALYASPTVDQSALVLTTEPRLPLTGRVERTPLPVGADRWLVAVAAREPLVGSFAQGFPWALLGGGLVSALLAGAVFQVLTRRRAYAMALVAERTGELERAHAVLSENQRFLERLLTAAPVLVQRMTVPDRVVSYVSPNIERLFGVTETAARAPGSWGSLVHPDDWPVFDAAHARVADGMSALETVEYRLRRGDGKPRWVSATLVPELDDSGRVVAVLGYIVDVDDRRRAEGAMREAQVAAEAANRAKNEFLSRMSHELRTPLNAVLGFGQLLELEALTNDQRDAVAHILKAGRHLLDLINEVLDISRIESGDLALSPEPVLAAELVQESVDLVRPLANQRGVQLVVDRASCHCYVLADRQRAKQILLNLLSNAVKYNRPRGTVAVSCRQHETQVAIAVADTGMGIPAERLGLLFTPFERLGAEQTAEEGTGIGLALSRRLAEAMEGTLTVESTLGHGSTFSLQLPRVEGPVERFERLNVAPRPVDDAPTTPRRVVLHIEDNLSNLRLVERILAQRPEIDVVGAMQGRLGLELAREHRPLLVLLDLHLPDMGGNQVLERLRDDPATASIPVVIVSADATSGQVRRLLSAGATAYLTKPIDVPELLRLVEQAIARS